MSGAKSGLPEPLPGREAAAHHWKRVLLVTVLVMMASGLVAAISWFVDLPAALVIPAITGLWLGLLVVFVGAIALGWTSGLRWYQSLGVGVRAGVSAICSFF